MIKRVFFDIGDVLVRYRPDDFFQFVREKSNSENDPRLFFSGDVFWAYESGEINTAEFFDVMQHMLNIKHVEPGILYYLFGRVLKVDRDMVALKRNVLASGVKVGIISNNNPFHVAILKTEYPEVLEGADVQIFSHKVGARKPDKEIYLAAFERARVSAGECLLIDDRPENNEAFRELGGIGYHYRAKNKNLSSDFLDTAVESGLLADFLVRIGLRRPTQM